MRITKKKSNFYYIRGIAPNGVSSGGVHLDCVTPSNFEDMSQLWRAVDDTDSDLTGPGI